MKKIFLAILAILTICSLINISYAQWIQKITEKINKVIAAILGKAENYL